MQTSVVVPTFNEAGNVVALLSRITRSLAPTDEVIIVDDGSDELPELAASERLKYSQDITIIRRDTADGGLGGAVVHGITVARGEVVVVCDGDLQHPPEVIPELVAAVAHSDVAVASRYCKGGDAGGLSNNWRQMASVLTGRMSKALFPSRLSGCSDPMSGFFAVRRTRLSLDTLRPNGFKILLEILLRSDRKLTVAEVPFTFGAREVGASHASLAEGGRFLAQLMRARLMNRAVGFMIVGASGVIPNLVGLYLLVHAGVHFVPATIIAIQFGIIWNFVGAELFVWRDQRIGQWQHRFAKFFLIGETDLLRLPFVIILVSGFGLHSVVASAITLAAAFLFRFTLADKLIYRRIVDAPVLEGVVNVDV